MTDQFEQIVREHEADQDFARPDCVRNPRAILAREATLIQMVRELRNPWISVDDRLPEKMGRYLAARHLFIGGKKINDSTPYFVYKEEVVTWLGASSGWQISIHPELLITHWMPLPEPPK